MQPPNNPNNPNLALSVASSPNIGYVLSDEQFPITQLVELGRGCREGRLRRRLEQRPLPALAGQRGPLRAGLAHPRRCRPAHHATSSWAQASPSPPIATAPPSSPRASLPSASSILAASSSASAPARPSTKKPPPASGPPTLSAPSALSRPSQSSASSGRATSSTTRANITPSKSPSSTTCRPSPCPSTSPPEARRACAWPGEHGDGLIADPQSATSPDLKAAFEEGARAAGKDPKTMPIISEAWAIVGNEDEARKYAQLWRFAPRATKDYTDNPDPRDIQRLAERDVPLEDVYKNWTVSPDPKVHIDALNKLIERGITTAFVHSPQEDQRGVIDFFAKRVLPELKRR